MDDDIYFYIRWVDRPRVEFFKNGKLIAEMFTTYSFEYPLEIYLVDENGCHHSSHRVASEAEAKEWLRLKGFS